MGSEIEVISSCLYASSRVIWKIRNFSKLNSQDGSDSDVFSVGNYKWKVAIYPKGAGEVYDHLSLYLCPVELTKSVDTKYYFAVTSQTDPNNIVRLGGNYKFSERNHIGRGLKKFMPLSDFHDPVKGYLVNDSCVITTQVICILKEEDGNVDGGTAEEIVSGEGSESKRRKIKDEKQ